jgi:hypothetical protein
MILTKKITEKRTMEYFRDNQSLVFPARRAPTMQPNNKQPTIAPLISLVNLFCALLLSFPNVEMKSFIKKTPEITPV